VVIGAQKAGSTYITQLLSQHPDIFIYPTEVPFFQDPDYKECGFGKFCELFKKGEGKKAVGFKRPNYLAKPECPERIRSLLPNVRIIAIYRNPIERAVSGYYHYMGAGLIPIRDLNTGLADILNGQYDSAYPASADILEYGFYATHLQRYLRFFPERSILSLLFDDITQMPAAAIRSVYRFLDVADDFKPRTKGKRPMATVRSLTRLRIASLVRGLTTYYNEDRTRTYRRNWIFARAVRMAYHAFDNVILAKLLPDPRITLDPALHDRLAEIYSYDIRQLQELLDKKLEDRWLSRKCPAFAK